MAMLATGPLWAVHSTATLDGDAPARLLDLGTLGRLLSYVALLALSGAWWASVLLVPRARRLTPSAAWRPFADQLWRIGRGAACLLLAATLLRGATQMMSLMDPAEPMTMPWLGIVVSSTTWGRGWSVQVVVAVLAIWCWRADVMPDARATALALLAALGAGVADALTGHGMGGEWGGPIGVSLHAVHLLGAGLWLGTLAVLPWPLYGRSSADRRALAAPLFRALPPLALTGSALVVGAGALMGLEYVGGWRALRALQERYAQLLALKIVVVLLIVALGAWHWRRSVPTLGRSDSDMRFRRTLGAELLLALLVVLLSAILVALPAAGV